MTTLPIMFARLTTILLLAACPIGPVRAKAESPASADSVRRGAAVFNDLCARCHRLGEAGSEVGPDLRTIAVHPKDHLLKHILEPDLHVSASYAAWRVETNDGGTLIGILKRADRDKVVLLQSKGKESEVSRSRIRTLEQTGHSFMPPGVLKDSTKGQVADLLEFIKSHD